MTKTNINRILVALDPSQVNRSTLQAATTLATNLDAELNALFVEDINLLRLAELPNAREVVYGSSSYRKISVDDMERSIHTQTVRLRKLVETIAQQYDVEITFDVQRGNVADLVCSASEKTDLLVIGKNTQRLRQSLKLGSITQTILSSTSCNLMVLQHGATLERPVAVFFSGSKGSYKALQLAIQIVEQDHKNLNVVYPASTEEEYNKLKQEVNSLTLPLDFEANHIQLKDDSTAAMLATLINCGARMLLLETRQDVQGKKYIQSLIEQSSTPIILIK